MTVFSCNGLSKTYNDILLFDDISFGMESAERIGIIGKNGAGKTTLMKIVAGSVSPDKGSVVFNSGIRYEYLDQDPYFQSFDIAIDYVMKGRKETFEKLNLYNELCNSISNKISESNTLNELSHFLDLHNGWNLENDAKKILNLLGIENYYVPVNELSGGLRKRVALATSLISEPDLLILDEPTNHLDADSVQWLQDYLMNYNKSLLFVTHDRYFLDSVSTKIIEIENKKIYSFPGNYEKYLEQKENITSSQESTNEHIKAKLRMELAWLQKGAKARRTKAKSRIDWIKMMEGDLVKHKEKNIKIEVGKTFIGSRVIDAHNISKTIDGKLLFDNFTYIAVPGDRIGIIGKNGCGKSTLLNILSGLDFSDSGTIKIGQSINIGYYKQDLSELNENQTVIGSIKEIAEYIDVGTGRDRYLTPRDLLNTFLFPTRQHGAYIHTLSGGEKKRLMLIKLLIANPNVLLLDEPTNDFDLQTLTALEDYLDNFMGTLLVVSHDRAFLDRIVNKIFCFEGDGIIKEYPGNYSDYLLKKESLKSELRMEETSLEPKSRVKDTKPSNNSKKKLSYNQQRELESTEQKINDAETVKINLIQEINNCQPNDYKLMENLSNSLAETENLIEQLTIRWMELSELADS